MTTGRYRSNRAKGGHGRAAKLTPDERAKIASKAAKARWHGRPRHS